MLAQETGLPSTACWDFVSVDNIVNSLLLFSLGFLSVETVISGKAVSILQAGGK